MAENMLKSETLQVHLSHMAAQPHWDLFRHLFISGFALCLFDNTSKHNKHTQVSEHNNVRSELVMCSMCGKCVHIVDQQVKNCTKIIFDIVLCNLMMFLRACPIDLTKWLQLLRREGETVRKRERKTPAYIV